MLNHQFSPEHLIHFICGRCRKPWTLSIVEDVTARAWTCPYCEFIARLEPMPPLPTGGQHDG
jgi:DNA-directed RNA polymerase subunit RPC12/RpoP